MKNIFFILFFILLMNTVIALDYPINKTILNITDCISIDNITVTPTLLMDNNEYILENCIYNYNNTWKCNCSIIILKTLINTINNYTFDIIYTTKYYISESHIYTSGGGGGGGAYYTTIIANNTINKTINITQNISDKNNDTINITQTVILNQPVQPVITIPIQPVAPINNTLSDKPSFIINNWPWLLGGIIMIVLIIIFIIVIRKENEPWWPTP